MVSTRRAIWTKWPAAAAAAALALVCAGVASAQERPARIAVVIDDMGRLDAQGWRALALPGPVTYAVLPFAPDARAVAGAAQQLGRETIVHLPMEPLGLADPGRDALTTWAAPAAIAKAAARAFHAVPGAVGFNNHMGSRFTACAKCLPPVLDAADRAGLFVLDSVTTPHSLLAQAARDQGLAAARRDLFLDTPGEEPRAVLSRAAALARAQGQAIVIGHPRPATLEALEAWLPRAGGLGVAVVPLSALMERRSRPQS